MEIPEPYSWKSPPVFLKAQKGLCSSYSVNYKDSIINSKPVGFGHLERNSNLKTSFRETQTDWPDLLARVFSLVPKTAPNDKDGSRMIGFHGSPGASGIGSNLGAA